LFSLFYIQNTKSKGVNVTFSEIYIHLAINHLDQKPRPKGLDKIFQKSVGRTLLSAAFDLEAIRRNRLQGQGLPWTTNRRSGRRQVV